MDVIYYYCFLFYKNIVKDDEPYATTVWILGFGEGFFLSAISDIISTKIFCYDLIKYSMLPIIGMTLLFNYFYFNKSGRAKKIVKEKPVFFGSHKISIMITTFFLIILISTMFWGPLYAKHLLDINCGSRLK